MRHCSNQAGEKTVLKVLTSASLLTLALTIAAPLAAQAADPAFCRGYAEAAVNQVRGGLANPACARGMHGDRWSSDFRVHFEWCRGQPIPAAEAERHMRTEYLRGCRG
jgi:hypothetical protein